MMSRVRGSTGNSGSRLFLLTFLTYAWFYAGAGWNQNAQFDLTRAIVERHTFAIDDYAANTGDVSLSGGHAYSNKAPGLSFLGVLPYAPLYALERAMGVDTADPVIVAFNGWLVTVAVVGLLTALTAPLLFGYARRRGVDPRWAAIVALTIVFATQLFPYSTLFMVHAPSGFLLLVALIAGRTPMGGLAAGAAASMNYLCLPAIVLFGRRPRFFAGAALPLILVAVYQRVCFGGFFTTSIDRLDPRFVTQGAKLGVLTGPSLEALIGITVSPYRGFFFFAPVLVTALGGMLLWWRDGDERRELVTIALMTIGFVGVNASFNGWEGGFGIGARYLVPLIPLFGLAMLRCRGWLRGATVALAVVSFAINFAATAVDPQPSGTIPRPLTQYILPLLMHGQFSPAVPITPPWSAATFTGHTSVNRLAHDEAIVFTRHPPGDAAGEWSSFNLGELLFGAGDARSLIPIVLLLAGGAIWIVRTATPRGRGSSAETPPPRP